MFLTLGQTTSPSAVDLTSDPGIKPVKMSDGFVSIFG